VKRRLEKWRGLAPRDFAKRRNPLVPWPLAYFGLNALRDPATALEAAVERAAEIAAGEFCNFVRYVGTRRYVSVAKMAAAAGGARWSDVKRLLQAEEGKPISDSEVTKLLRNLVDYGFLEKRGELHAMHDLVLGGLCGTYSV
jgi:Predicted ATPase (AAA+ superfamily)